MTIQELSQFRWLRLEVARYQRELKRTQRQLKTARGEEAEALRGLCGFYREILMKRQAELESLEDFIATADDPYLRRVLEARFVQGQSWRGVSVAVGGYVSEDTIKKMVQRYLQKSREKPPEYL